MDYRKHSVRVRSVIWL